MEFKKKDKYSMDDLLQIMKILRAPGGCPWDREQTHQSIRNCFIEETYEAIEAIDTEDPILLQEELGDVLLQVLFHSEIEQEEGRFDFSDVVDGEAKKMVERHPHVFGSVTVDGADELGDLLYSVVNVARYLHVSAEQSLGEACEKFIRRFQKVEELAGARGLDMKSAGIEELDKLWNEAKETKNSQD